MQLLMHLLIGIKINMEKIIDKDILKTKLTSETISLASKVGFYLSAQSSPRNLNSLWPDRKQPLQQRMKDNMMICMFKNKQFFKVHFNLRDLKRKKQLPHLLIAQKEFRRNISSLQNKLLNLSYSLSETGGGPDAWLLFLSAQNASQSF